MLHQNARFFELDFKKIKQSTIPCFINIQDFWTTGGFFALFFVLTFSYLDKNGFFSAKRQVHLLNSNYLLSNYYFVLKHC